MKYTLEGLECPACADKIEQELHKLEGLSGVNVNFVTKAVYFNPEQEHIVQQAIAKIEPGVKLINPAAGPLAAPQGEDGIMLKAQLIRIAIAALLFAGGLLYRQALQNTPYNSGEYLVFLMAYLLVGSPVIKSAIRNSLRGQLFDENMLMTIATTGAIILHELPEAVGVMLFFAVGELFQEIAVNRSRRSIATLMDVRPEYANLVMDGETRRVAPDLVSVGHMIEVKPGEKVPLDGEVIEGSSFIDSSALTGESVPRKVRAGDGILAGVINTSGLLRIRVTREFNDSAVMRILELVENASTRKAPTEKFITRFARWYTPAVVAAALTLAIIPPLLLPGATFSQWFYRALLLLVISCPCALVISIPLGYFGGIGGASRSGILIKGANFLDALTNVHTAVFDKTGTLTKGVFRVVAVVPAAGFTQEEVLRWAAQAEFHSNHPIARSILEAFHDNLEPQAITDYMEIEGQGIKATISSKTILAGNNKLMVSEAIIYDEAPNAGTVIYIAVDGLFAGYLIIADEIKQEAAQAISDLRKLGVKRIVMLTGDLDITAQRVAAELGLDSYYAGLLPQDKLNLVEELAKQMPNNAKLVFAGDGINDAPVINRADIGVAMGALGSDAAIEAADVVLMDDNPLKLPQAIKIANYTKKIVIQNIILALGIKGIFMVLAIGGMATLWEAVFADVGVALAAVFNAARTLKYSSSS